jgi:hypothetical protein
VIDVTICGVCDAELWGYRKLNAIRTRRMPKVWLHVMNGAALANAAGNLRRCEAYYSRDDA